jgi:acyl-CoA synthetase (AMP-forming)/AMP-acid ligase II/acyl carrier protein
MNTTLLSLIKMNADRNPDAPAMISIDGETVTFDQLHKLIQGLVDDLNQLGIDRGDRVAVVIPNGPEMALAFLAVSSTAACAPLNPNYRAPEFDFHLEDLQASTVLEMDGMKSLATEVARSHNIPILKITHNGNWTKSQIFLDMGEVSKRRMPRMGEPDDTALLLHTSGTTAHPKRVPITQHHICTSAINIATALQLTPADRCMNIMPLFHIHGLMAGLCASLQAGGSVVCTPGFYAPSFFEWLESTSATWYTAVPTMHQSILERSHDQAAILERIHLRFIRSSSAPLPPAALMGLESVFKAPLIEAYGMTEAAHQIASNPMPPRIHKPGSVGLPAGPEVAILTEGGAIQTTASYIGEIVLRGENIIAGYESNPEANTEAFLNGWFRTGDNGHFDSDGYLFITGRLKEMINRAGEKISPREIDEALLEHPAVAQAMAFAIPDPKLGENIAAAIVLRTPGTTEKELRHFLSERLSAYKIPTKIIFIEEIPKGPTGKPQRIDMAKKLGLDSTMQSSVTTPPAYLPARTQTEERLAGLWRDVLKVDQVSIRQPFLELGGDSMTAMQLANRICEWLGVMINLVDFFEAQTIAEQAVLVDELLLNNHNHQSRDSGDQH